MAKLLYHGTSNDNYLSIIRSGYFDGGILTWCTKSHDDAVTFARRHPEPVIIVLSIEDDVFARDFLQHPGNGDSFFKRGSLEARYIVDVEIL